jgi:hypothetical protein
VRDAVARRVEARASAGQFAGLCSDEAEALAAASLMAKCGDCQNAWHAEDLTNEFGELYEGAGTLYACNVRLCPSCMAALRRRSSKRAREGMNAVTLQKGERWYFVTLTMPTLAASKASLLASLRVMLEAWGEFVKHGAFDDESGRTVKWTADPKHDENNKIKGITRASVKGVEFTLGKRHEDEGREWSAESDGYHVHIHAPAVARWIGTAELRRAWSECLRRAWSRRGIEAGINTSDRLAVCHVRLVTNRRVKRSGSVISIDAAVNEVAKYITKADSFLSIPDDQLIEVAAVRRWSRMFEVLGDCRKRRATQGDAEGREPATDAERYLDTQNLSSAEDWRGERLKRMLRESRPRSIPLRTRGVALLMIGEGQLFEEELAAHVAEVRSYRRTMLSDRFPLATFRTLAGSLWYGTDKNPARGGDAGESYAARIDFANYAEANAAPVEEARASDRAEWRAFIEQTDATERRFTAAQAEREEWLNFVNGRTREGGRWVDDWGVDNYEKMMRAGLWEFYKADKARASLAGISMGKKRAASNK